MMTRSNLCSAGLAILEMHLACYTQQAIANAVELPKINYPDALGAIMNQHGWNLVWFGVVTTVGGVFIWKGNITAIWLSAMIGGLADLGYFIFLDLGGHVKFVPGTVMTIIALAAILLSGGAYFKSKPSS